MLSFLAGCASLNSVSIAPTLGKSINLQPRFQEENNDCGLAAVSTLLNYFSIQHSYDNLKKQFPISENEAGYSTSAVNRMLSVYNLNSYLISGNLNLLKRHLSKRRPVIALIQVNHQKLSNTVFQDLEIMVADMFNYENLLSFHYVVVVGYNDKSIEYFDPQHGFTIKKTSDFEQLWSSTKYTLILAGEI